MSTSKSEPITPLLKRLPDAPHYCVAFSGGVDSHVLLHAMTAREGATAARLTAVHVDHGLQAQSGEWTVHCRTVCADLGVAVEVLHIDARRRPGESPEAAARRARYQALADWLPADAVLLTAQHRDDQAETLLLQLFRGAGPRGLAAMPAEAPFGRGRLVRPLLDRTRAEIVAYARRHRLHWVEDPSNADLRYARNRLRRQLLPSIRQHWPGIDRVLARAAELQADQSELAASLAAIDLASCTVADQPAQLDTVALSSLDRARQRNLLRYWIDSNGFPLPSLAIVDRIIDTVVSARPDASPDVHWPGAQVRRYRRHLFVMSPLATPDPARRFTWNLQQSLELPAGGGTLHAQAVTGKGLRAPPGNRLVAAYRQGGERLQPVGRAGHHALKKLFQEWRVPEWERARVPLLFSDGALVAVAGYCIAEGCQAAAGEPGYEVHWQRTAANR